ncbi:MAG: M3 family metallopeptidase [Candidatus Azobacteroides sp.]|nr:M3 family metallopeptidase [Candidatus Azobacteroides sp.]
MKKILLILSFAMMLINSCKNSKEDNSDNPLLSEFRTPFALPPFHKIKASHFIPAFQQGMKEQNDIIQTIINNKEKPDFENTIVPLENSSNLLNQVSFIFYGIENAESTKELQQINQEISPLLAQHEDNIFLNSLLFEKIKSVFENREKDNLNSIQIRLLEKYYKKFIRAGIWLPEESKTRLKEINTQLTEYYVLFGNNLLKETNSFRLIIEEEEKLKGLPETVKTAAKNTATADSPEGKWIFTLQKPSLIPVLQYAEDREIRKNLYQAYINRGNNNNENDNKKIILSITKLRQEKAELLGYPHFADFKLQEMMAENAENIYHLLNNIWKASLSHSKAELAEMQEIAEKENYGDQIAAWDWWYFAEKLRKEKYDLDEKELKPYFQLENVRDGAFRVANQLFGISFTPLEEAPVYHPEVKAYEVKDQDGSHIGIFYTDYFPRPGKRAGAWMGLFREQKVENGIDIRPVVYNVANFTRPEDGIPALLSLEEVRTLYHEFGHALHGLLTKGAYASLSGVNVATDFVELPSQLMEHWATEPEVLKMYARHYRTGEIIPDELIEKLTNATFFNQGFQTTELAAAALLDMEWHTTHITEKTNVDSLEKEVKENLNMIPEITFRYHSANFNHIFSNEGYAAGYYSYLWAEVLEADAFELFKEKGIFDRQTATSYRQHILEKGDSEEPMKLYMQFRKKEPDVESLLKNRGLK